MDGVLFIHIRESRHTKLLCEEAHLNLAYRWFCRLSLEDETPNHSTFSKNRHDRFRDSDLFRWLFNEVLRRCMQAGLVKGEGFAVDASIIKANASRQRGVPGDEEVNWSDPSLSTRAVREYLKTLDEDAEEYLCPAGNVLRSEWRAFARHKSQHHLPIQTVRLRGVSDESQVLPEHFDSQDRSQRP